MSSTIPSYSLLYVNCAVIVTVDSRRRLRSNSTLRLDISPTRRAAIGVAAARV